MDRLIHMILRQIMRRLVNKGISAGVKKAGSMRKPGNQPEQSSKRQRQIRQAAKMLRRMTRF